LAWLLVGILWTGMLAAAEPSVAVVGKRGDPTTFQFEGARTFKPAAIASGLRYDPLFLFAARHDGPMDLLLGVVADQVRNGYRQGGFADAQVAAALSPDASRLIVKIDEGSRSVQADVVIEAPGSFPSELLREWLTTRQPPPGGFVRTIQTTSGPQVQWFDKDGKPKALDAPVWTRGDPAPFAEATWSHLETRIEKGLQSLGWAFAKPRVEVRRHADDPALADLVVKMTNPGPRNTLSDLEVRGATSHTPEMIEAWLGLKAGTVVDSHMLTEVRRRLIESARFRKVDVTTASTDTRGVRKLIVTVEEYASAPLLGDPLSPEEQVILKFGEWMQTSAAVEQEFEVSMEHDLLKFDCVLAPQLGTWARVQMPRKGENRQFWSEFYADHDGATLALPLSRIKYLGSNLGPSAIASTRLGASESPQRDEEGFSLLFGFGMGSENDLASPAPFRWLIFVEPAAALGLVHRAGVKVRLDPDSLELTDDVWRLKVNARDGTLQEFESVGQELKFMTRFRRGSLAERKAEFDHRIADFEDWHDPQRPAASLCRCLVKSVEQWVAFRPMDKFATRVAERMCQDPAFDGLDRALREIHSLEGFTIPRTQENNFNALVYHLGFLVVDHVTRRDDWAWQIGRDLMLQHNGQASFAAADLARIVRSPDFGPVGCLIIAEGAQFVSPRLARPLAARGLGQLSLDDFRTDYRFLLRGDTLVGQLTRAAAEEIRSMPNADLTALIADAVPGAARQADVAAGLRRWRQTGKRPLDEALPPLLDDLWFDGLRDLVAAGLKRFTK
jgi:hypothetical protein